jgi:hypothetical protein
VRHRSWLAYLLVLSLWPAASAHAQTTGSLSGVVTDESKAVLPGVTVTASEPTTGWQQAVVTDERGEYRLLKVSAGTYKMQAEIQGFTTVVVPTVELLVGQNAAINFVLKIGGLEETLTVTSQAPIIDLASSSVKGNVDRRQMEDLPLQGRNWMELSMLVKGVTANNADNRPGTGSGDSGFQLNLDGQQVTNRVLPSSFGNPKFSREAIAEFQIVTNGFDITQGRSTGVQVQAITRSGTNNLSGAAFGYFRDDKFNAADHIAGKVLPYSNQQFGGVIGGPIIQDKLHYFLSYEYERQPSIVVSQPTLLPGQSFNLATKETNKSYFGRVDYKMSNRDNLTVRIPSWNWINPYSVNATIHPSQAEATQTRASTNVSAMWSRVHSNATVAQLLVAYNGFDQSNANHDIVAKTPEYRFPGLTVGGRYNYPSSFAQRTYQLRYDLTSHRKNHDLKLGGEFLRVHDRGTQVFVSVGVFTFSRLPSDIGARIPADAALDPSRWNMTGLEPFVQKFEQNFHGNNWMIDMPRPTWAMWFGDTWRATDRLTLNYGVRWDDDWGATAPPGIVENTILINNGRENRDVGYKANIRDHNNVAPRAGFTYQVGGANDLVVRGGTGIYYGGPESTITSGHQLYNQLVAASFVYDGRPGFMEDPRRGVTGEQLLSGQVPVPAQTARILSPDFVMPYTWQSSVGFQKQLGTVTGIEADVTHWIWYNDIRNRDPNLFYDPATGYNVDPRFGRPNKAYDQINFWESTGRKDNLALSTGLTRRLRDNFQGGLTYTLMLYAHDDGNFSYTEGPANNPFDTLDGEWAQSGDFQRHTLRAQAMYRLPWGFRVSGLYMYGSANRFATSIAARPYGKLGVNRLNLGAPIKIPEAVLDRFDGPAVIGTGELVPRNALRGTPLHKVDMRISKDLKVGHGVSASLIAEVFNLLDHANYGSFVGTVESATFGSPRQSTGNAYVPRSGQLGFRIAF